MPSLARKILILAAADGLVLSPVPNPRPRPASFAPTTGTVEIEYNSQNIRPYLGAGDGKSEEILSSDHGLEVFGIAGLLTVSPTSAFVIAITKREQAALIKNRYPIYVIADIVLIPLSSRIDAQAAIEKSCILQQDVKKDGEGLETDAEDEGDDASTVIDDDLPDDDLSDQGRKEEAKEASSIGQDVIGKKGVYGRFAEQWFSKRGWTVDQRRAEGMSSDENTPAATPSSSEAPMPSDSGQTIDIQILENKPASVDADDNNENVQSKLETEADVDNSQFKARLYDDTRENVTHTLTPKLLHTTRLLLASSRSFFFSYEWDITRSWEKQQPLSSSLPLFKRVDPLFFWNHHLQNPFIEGGQHSFVLPLMQGFIGQRSFSIPTSSIDTPKMPPDELSVGELSLETSPNPVSQPLEKSLLLTLISRRSIRRAGLRYLRRGTDDSGSVANSVETEQLISSTSWDHVFSYVQIRGSIPVFFQQSPYALRPKPVLLRSPEANKAAFELHFRGLRERYGDIHAVSLVEKGGSEAIVGNRYQEYITEAQEGGVGVGWNWFDFHRMCRGMRFENVSLLFEEIGEALDRFGYGEEKDGEKVGEQQGVLRTNCMDCLDRTNVVQSASARRALEKQLKSVGIELGASETEWFNILWADNGDAISKQYASTAALKGDFTRTRKRNYRGALTDFGLTMSRYFTNIISDFFTQATIDFLLGNVTAHVFTEFEADMMSGDPALSMKKIRENAIEISSKIVIADETEMLLGGWVLLAPATENTIRSLPFREKILLLTDAAVYDCKFDFPMEKVVAFERVDLRNIFSLQKGTYITSTLAPTHTDPKRNVGFILHYRPSSTANENVIRVNTRSLRSTFSKNLSSSSPSSSSDTTTRILAFKAPTTSSSSSRNTPGNTGEDEGVLIKEIVKMIEETASKGADDPAEGNSGKKHSSLAVVEKDVIGAEQAKKFTGVLEQWGYTLRKLVWA